MVFTLMFMEVGTFSLSCWWEWAFFYSHVDGSGRFFALVDGSLFFILMLVGVGFLKYFFFYFFFVPPVGSGLFFYLLLLVGVASVYSHVGGSRQCLFSCWW